MSSFTVFWRVYHKMHFQLGPLSWSTTLVPFENESADSNWEKTKRKGCFPETQIEFLWKFRQAWHTVISWLDPLPHLKTLTFHPNNPKSQRVIIIIQVGSEIKCSDAFSDNSNQLYSSFKFAYTYKNTEPKYWNV